MMKSGYIKQVEKIKMRWKKHKCLRNNIEKYQTDHPHFVSILEREQMLEDLLDTFDCVKNEHH